jgi:SAM-dependent methyltransferase
MKSSVPLFNALASDYDAHFAVTHRRAYDELAWEYIQPLLPRHGGLIIDAGCGTGRWASRLLDRGCEVIGIERAPAMAAAARARCLPRFQVIEGSIEAVDLPEGRADVVLALGSLQYTRDPLEAIARFVQWTRPGGAICVLVDSCVALAIELSREDHEEEAERRLASRMAVWSQGGISAEYHLLDRGWLEEAFADAGLVDIDCHGLLIGFSVFGRDMIERRLRTDWTHQMGSERRLGDIRLLADLGKQILAHGRLRLDSDLDREI